MRNHSDDPPCLAKPMAEEGKFPYGHCWERSNPLPVMCPLQPWVCKGGSTSRFPIEDTSAGIAVLAVSRPRGRSQISEVNA